MSHRKHQLSYTSHGEFSPGSRHSVPLMGTLPGTTGNSTTMTQNCSVLAARTRAQITWYTAGGCRLPLAAGPSNLPLLQRTELRDSSI
ncbi:hypothetical protein EJ04DRAFT_583772 [Polyplosphaeria fusca]|uniref:Uncharacterized protein n=1 Tax=Polyplosphaeria fusca TaxID=682080 RepID=A0A9P4QRT6_9PLEO|nr:hypothetical protein EJ04DRAFT_583772 [Polyplosphaeria fusca]